MTEKTDIEIWSDEQRIWEDTKVSCETAIKNHKEGIIFNTAILKLAKEKLAQLNK